MIENVVALDLETTGIAFDEKGARILTSGVYGNTRRHGDVKYVALHDETWNPDMYEQHSNWRRITRELVAGSPNAEKWTLVGHNLIGFDLPWMIWHGRLDVGDIDIFDTQVAYSLLDETGEKNSLLALTKMFNPDLVLAIQVMEAGKAMRASIREQDLRTVLEYNKHDALATHQLYAPLKRRLKEAGRWDLFQFLMGVGKSLANMMARGVNIDVDWIKTKKLILDMEQKKLDTELKEILGDLVPEDFNINSTTQLAELLFVKLKMPVVQKTRTGNPSTSESAIRELSALAKRGSTVKDLFDALLQYRGNKKLIGTYMEPLVNKHRGASGRVHTQYHLGKSRFGGTVTGRLSSSKPNLQNIPRDLQVKGAFVPSAGRKLYEADYAQLELRVAAWYANEESMMDAFAAGRDIHTQTLAEIKGVSYDKANANVESGTWKEDRALIKRINFGILYGASAKKISELARDMGVEVSIGKATNYVKKWYKVRPNLRMWIASTEDEILHKHQVATPTGRVRHLPDASRMTGYGMGQLRQGVNFLIQSLASDITLAALRAVDDGRLRDHTLLLTVHDSVVGEYNPRAWLEDEFVGEIQKLMTYEALSALPVTDDWDRNEVMAIPLAVDVNLNLSRWGE